MKKTVELNDMMNDDRLTSAFTSEGISCLFDMLVEYEESCDTEIEYDAVAFRCEYTQYTYDELIYTYGYLLEENFTDEERDAMDDFAMVDFFSEYTTIRIISMLDGDDNYLLQDF